MPQFRVQRSNTLFVLKNFASFFFTQSVKDTRNKNKNKNANNRTQDTNKNETRCPFSISEREKIQKLIKR